MLCTMDTLEQIAVTITLSPTQVDEVVRAASRSRAPSVSTLIANRLKALPQSADGTQSAPAEDTLADGTPALADRRSPRSSIGGESPTMGYLPIDATDPRLSRSLQRGLSLLTCFDADGAARGIVELAHDAGMSPSTAHRYASTLVELGLLERCPKSRKYRLPGV